MRTPIRTISVVTGAALAAALIAAPPVSAEPTTSSIDWQPCADAPEVDCATIDVPVDWSEPEGETIQIGLARRAATDPDARIGSLLMDPGGPGGSGVDVVKDAAFLSQDVQSRFDIIGFDPRGVNTSTQILCDAEDADAAFGMGVPGSQREFKKLAKANRILAKGCRELTGPLFDNADNLNTVEDIEAVRQALGDGKLNFLGYSYGTLMGQQYAEAYPENIRAMVLDGNMDHSLESTWEFASTETAAVERNFEHFAQWCDTTSDCALYGLGTAEIYGQLREAARDGELMDPETGEAIDFYRISQLIFNVNFPQVWPDLADKLKTLRTGEPGAGLTAVPEPEPINLVFHATFCADWDVPIRNFKDLDRMSGKLAMKYPNVQWSPYVENLIGCVGYPGETTNPQAPLEIEGAPPLVMIGNLGDFATVYPWSQTAAEQSGATLVTYEGYGHTIYGNGYDCIDNPIDDYLINLTVPDEGLSCPGLEVPGGDQGISGLSDQVPGPYSRI